MRVVAGEQGEKDYFNMWGVAHMGLDFSWGFSVWVAVCTHAEGDEASLAEIGGDIGGGEALEVALALATMMPTPDMP